MQKTAQRLFLFTFTILASAQVDAAPPDVKSLFPPGGTRGETVEVTLTGNLGTAPVAAWCSCPDLTVAVPEKGNQHSVTIAPEAQPGLCWLRFSNAEGVSALKPFFIGTLPEVLEAEPNNELAAAQSLPSSQVVVNGTLDKAGDVDVFSVELKKGETLVASMEANRTLGSPMDGLLQLVSPAGFVLEQNDDDRGTDPQIVYLAEADGTYFVRTFAFPAMANSSVRLAGGADYIYRLTVTTGAFADHVLPLAISAGSSSPVEVEVVGWNIPAELRELVVESDTAAASRSESHTVHHPQLANTVAVAVKPHATVVKQTPNGRDHPQPIELPATITGRIEAPRDVDVYRFRAEKKQNVRIRVEARSLLSPLDPLLRLIGPDGQMIREIDDAGRDNFDCELTYAIPADCEYRVEVTDRFRHGGMRFVYRLTVEVPQPDFSLNAAADAFKLTPGKPLEIPVTVNRKDGFAEEIEVTIDGLPEGISAAAVRSLPKGDSSKTVKLVVNGTLESSWNGPIRIVGTSGGEPPKERIADAPVAGLQARTSHLWLTALQGKP